jgi:CO/xanthine dehydrogenase Mo-binding subunit
VNRLFLDGDDRMPREMDPKTKSVGAQGKVCGESLFTADLHLPEMLIGKGLYSEYPRAKIHSIDTSIAESIDGVFAVITHADLPSAKHFGAIEKDQQILAIDEVFYIGDMIAAVAAESEHIAVRALKSIKVVYEPIPGIFDPVEALNEGAIFARSDLESNVLGHEAISHGDVDKGFALSDVVVAETFRTQSMEHLFLETEAVVADWDGEFLTIYASGQHPHGDRDQVAEALGIPVDNVRVLYPYIGGAFGGKEDMHIQLQTAALAIKAGRSVKMVRSRHESMLTHTKRPGVVTQYEIGASFDGVIQAIRVKIVLDSGPYSNLSPAVMIFAVHMASGPYKIPNAQIDGYCVATNNLITGAFRGFGGPEVAFAQEQCMDLLAEKLGIDPIEIRLKNGMEQGTLLPKGAYIPYDIGLKETIRQAAQAANWSERSKWLEREPAPNLRRGLGVATIMHEIGMGAAYEDISKVIVEMKPDGAVVLSTGSAELGQGTFTAQAIIAAEVLGIEVKEVTINTPDTALAPDASTTSASRSTYMVGNAVYDAAMTIRNTLLEIASNVLEAEPEELAIEDGNVWDPKNPDRVLEISGLAEQAWEMDQSLRVEGTYSMWYPRDPIAGKESPIPHAVFAYATHIIQVLVDTETGFVTVEKVWAAHDVGKAINPPAIEGQIDGGVLMGIGYALMEELIQEDGRLVNSKLSEYVVPMVGEAPEIEHIIIEVPEPTGPFGAKGVGEPTTTPVAPAIANAVADAIGIRMTEIPMTPERVWRALKPRDS